MLEAEGYAFRTGIRKDLIMYFQAINLSCIYQMRKVLRCKREVNIYMQ